MHPVRKAFSRITVDESASYNSLTVFPLISAFRSSLDYLLLAEGLRQGLVSVRELSEGGSVPDLVVENRAKVAVLIVDGEELAGAKQNRVANLSMLIPAGQTTTIPVSCVEQGRWAYDSPDFNVTGQVQYARGRSEKLASVQRSMRATGTRRSDQAQVWDSIGEKAEMLDAGSPTQAMAAIFERHSQSLDDYVAAFKARDDQVGAIFLVGDALFGLDVFDRPSTFTALLPKLIRSYGIDALEHRAESEQAHATSEARAFLDRLLQGTPQDHPAVGLGNDVGIIAEGLVAGGLVVDDIVVHLTAFSESRRHQPSPGPDESHASYRQRRSSLRRRYR